MPALGTHRGDLGARGVDDQEAVIGVEERDIAGRRPAEGAADVTDGRQAHELEQHLAARAGGSLAERDAHRVRAGGDEQVEDGQLVGTTMLRPNPVEARLSLNANAGTLRVNGAAGLAFVIERSLDLQSWQRVVTNLAPFQLDFSPHGSNAFFRARSH